MKTRFKSLFTALLATAIVAPAAWADRRQIPSRPIAWWSCSGGRQRRHRQPHESTQKAGDLSGFNFVVENRPGAGGNLALDAVATAAPDGYTVVFATPGIAINPSLYAKVPTSSPISRRSRWSARRR